MLSNNGMRFLLGSVKRLGLADTGGSGMKRYSSNQAVPMKFHHLYVWLLNPLGILAIAALALLSLLTALNVTVIPEIQTRIDGNGTEAARIMLWVMFGIFSLAFLFSLISEILLAERRTLGVVILILGYVLNTASSAVTAYNERSTENIIAFAIAFLIGLLVCIYYWKRRRLFH